MKFVGDTVAPLAVHLLFLYPLHSFSWIMYYPKQCAWVWWIESTTTLPTFIGAHPYNPHTFLSVHGRCSNTNALAVLTHYTLYSQYYNETDKQVSCFRAGWCNTQVAKETIQKLSTSWLRTFELNGHIFQRTLYY